jgi:hypothetical protein
VRVALGVTASPADFAIDGNAVAFEGFRPYAENFSMASTSSWATAARVPIWVHSPQGDRSR